MRPDKLIPILLGIALTIVGIGIPLTFGYAVQFVSDVDVNVLLDNLANVTNHSVIIASKAVSGGQTLDATSDGEYYTTTVTGDSLDVWTWLDKNKINDIDKIVIEINIFDKANTSDEIYINYQLWTYDSVKQDVVTHLSELKQVSSNLSKYEIIITPTTKLRIRYGESMPEYNDSFALYFEVFDNQNTLQNAVIGYNVKIYKCSHLNSELIMNGMLAGSGFIMLIFAWAATPFWNPTTRRRRR